MSVGDSDNGLFPSGPRLLWRFKSNTFLSADFGLAALLAVVVVFAYRPSDATSATENLLLAQLALVVALLGVVLGAMAVFLAVLEPSYLAFVASAKKSGGLVEAFFQFWFTAALAIVSAALDVFGVLALRLGWSQRLLVGLACLAFFWTLFAILGLIRFIANHGMIRTEFARRTTPGLTSTVSATPGPEAQTTSAEDMTAEDQP
jgi:hypothetical protein